MRYYPRFSAICAIAATAIASTTAALATVIGAIERYVAVVWALTESAFKAEPMVLAGEGPALIMDGRPLDRSLLHSLRHEAGTRQRGIRRKQ